MFKPTRPLYRARRRLQLTTKQVGAGYYKGNRTGSMGDHTRWGGYIIDWTKVRTYVPPDRLDVFKLTPFVTQKMEPTKTGWDGRVTGHRYINLVRDVNPEEFNVLVEEYLDSSSGQQTSGKEEAAPPTRE